MSTIDKKIQDFCRKYNARIKPSSQRFARSQPLTYSYDSLDDDFKVVTEYVPGVEINMPEDLFRTLVHMEDKLKEWTFDERLRGSRFVDYVNHIYEKEYREVSIREKYPAVKRAYEQYQILLAMSEVGEAK